MNSDSDEEIIDQLAVGGEDRPPFHGFPDDPEQLNRNQLVFQHITDMINHGIVPVLESNENHGASNSGPENSELFSDGDENYVFLGFSNSELPAQDQNAPPQGRTRSALAPVYVHVDNEADVDADISEEETAPEPNQNAPPSNRLAEAIQMLVDENMRMDGMDWRSRSNVVQRMRRMIYGISSRRNQLQRRNSSHFEGMESEENAPNADEIPPENAINFDTNLPAEHTYMGDNMNRVSGVNYLDVNSTARLMLFSLDHIIFPGEVLPFMTVGPILEADRNSQSGLLFGIIFTNLNTKDRDVYYGVTFHIYEKGEDDRGNIMVKSRALQRFVVKSSDISGPLLLIHQNTGEMRCHGYVRILPEVYLPDPLKSFDMGCLNRFHGIESMKKMYSLYQGANTPLPMSVFKTYSINDIVAKARTKLEQHKIDTMPYDPVRLSYWLVRNLHLPEGTVKKIFLTDSVNLRFQEVMNSIDEDKTVFTCRHCNNRIANCDQLFAMSKHGVQTQYCNSAGFIHETNTVYKLINRSFMYVGSPSAEFSWFPGYQWHSISCRMCSHHVGWEFKAVDQNLVPRRFFGISSSSVRVSRTEARVPHGSNAEMYQNLLRWARGDME